MTPRSRQPMLRVHLSLTHAHESLDSGGRVVESVSRHSHPPDARALGHSRTGLAPHRAQRPSKPPESPGCDD
jgi:hypothetical protein